MAITDLFSTSFLFSVAIIIILIGGVIAYVSYRMSEQDNKIGHMVGLVSLLAGETQQLRDELHKQKTQESKLEYASQLIEPDLISVSDNEYDTEDEDEDEEDDDEEEEEENEEKEEEEENEVVVDKKIIKLNHPTLFVSEPEFEFGSDVNITIDTLNKDLEEFEDSFKEYDAEDDLIADVLYNSTLPLQETFEEVEFDNIIQEEEPKEEEPKEEGEEAKEEESKLTTDVDVKLTNEDLTSISAVDLGDLEDHTKTDYKKMSLNKLREIVVSKELVADASKLKKNEILKLLGHE
jgi:hypothetical protein